MKNCLTLFILAVMLSASIPLSAQMEYYAVPWAIWLYDESTHLALEGADVDATIMYKNADGEVLFSEGHSGVTNSHGNFVFKVGDGVPISGVLTAPVYKEITRFCYSLNVVYNGETKMIDGEQPVLAAGRANSSLFSCDAGNAFGLGGFAFAEVPVPFGTMICPIGGEEDFDNFVLFNRRDRNGIKQSQLVMSPINDLIRMKQAKNINTSELINYSSFGLGLGKPVYCGPDPEFLYGLHGITMPNLYGLRYGVDLRLENDGSTMNTATLNAENLEAGGAAFRGFASTGGLFYGGNGTVGVAQGTGTGTGVYGIVGTEPASGESKYALYGNTNGHGFSYSAYHNGPWVMTEAGMVISDRSFKRNIQPLGSTLDKVNQLHPDVYEFNEDSRFHFADGLHYGFIAQEMESVFPQLVSDVLLPTNINFETNSANGTESHKAINYTGLIPILTSSIQELDAKVVKLETQLDAMNQVIEELKEQVAILSEKK